MSSVQQKSSVALLATLSLCNVALYFANWGGDPEVHIAFAKNWVQGKPFQFNAGEFSTGETSPLYMAIVAFLASGLPTKGVVVGMKTIGVLSTFGIVWQVRAESVRQLGDRWNSWFIPLCFVAMPLVFFQAFLGMENMLMACLMMPLVSAILRVDGPEWSHRALALTTLLLGIATLLRPEAVFFGLALAVHLLMARRFLCAFLVGVGCLTIAMLLVVGIERYTGVPLHGAGTIRVLTGRASAWNWELFGRSFLVHPKPLRAFVYVWAIFIPIVALFKKRVPLEPQVFNLLSTCVLLPVALQFFGAIPTTHSSRYLLPSYATVFMVLPGLVRAATVRHTMMQGILVVSAILAFVAENVARYRSGTPGMLRSWTEMAVGETRRDVSDFLCRVATCGVRPVVVAAQEVQVRLRLDERFVVRSLDGIVDHHLGDYVREWGVDHLGYLRDRRVDVLVGFPDFNLDGSKFSLSQLKDLRIGEARTVDGFRFERVPGHPFFKRIVLVRRLTDAD